MSSYSSSSREYFDKYASQRNPAPVVEPRQTGNNTLNNQQGSSGNNANNINQGYSSNEAELAADISASLRYASDLNNGVVISGSSDYSKITTLKNAILELRSSYFSSNNGLSVQGQNRDELDRRFLLIEHELDGLLRRRIQYSAIDYQGGSRNLDFTTLLNEKETQIVELEKKIQNFEERLRRAAAREIELENKIVALKAENLTLRDKSYTGEKLEDALKREAKYEQALKDLDNYKENFAAAASLWNSQLSQLAAKYPNDRLQLNGDLNTLLQRSGVKTYNFNGFTTVEVHSSKTVEVPVQDARTKHLIHLLATNLRTLSLKYPKITTEINAELVEFFQQELIDVIEVDELDRVVEIVKFVPQAVRVENVYAYSSSKSRRVEFHLRVLVKALLEELEKLKLKHGAVLDIDEGVIGMINQEIMGVVSVDDILKVFRVVPKIVEVEKIIERIVERIVEVPQVIPVERYVEKVIEVPKFVEVERIVHVPVEIIKVVDNIIEKLVQVPTITEKVVEVPTYKEKIVENKVEVPRIIEVEKIVDRIVVNTEVVEIKTPVHHVVPEIKEIVKVVEKVVTVETVVEKIVEVPVYVEKIVEKIVEVPKLVEIEIIKEKIIVQKVYEVVGETNVVIREVIKEVPIYIEKIVPVETVVQHFTEVTKIIEKPVPLRSVETIIKEVEVIREKLVPVVQIKEVERINNVIVEKIKEVEKIIDRKVEVPIIQERIVRVPEEIVKIVIEKVHVPQIIPVERFSEKIVYETKIVEVEKPIIQYIKDIQIVKCAVEKIVEVPRTVERIKEVRVRVEKIVEKLVEVPKVVEVEKIVEKIVVVPRVIEKIVEVPQIIEVIVEKIIERETVRQVQVVVEKIVQVEKPVEVEKVKNVYIQIEKPVEKIVEKIVPFEKIVERKEVIEKPVEKIITVKNEVPKELIVEKIVAKIVEREKLVEVEKPCTLVVEVPVEVEKIIEKPVKVIEYQEKLVNSVEIVEKPIPAYIRETQIVEVERVIEKPIEITVPTVHTETKVVVQEKIVEVPQYVEKTKLVPQMTTEIKVVERVIEKIIERLVEIPKIVTVEVINEKIVEKIQVVELETVIPQLIKINEIVERIVEKIVPVHTVEQVFIEVPVIQEKIVQVATTRVDKQAVETVREKVTEVSKLVNTENVINRIETEVQIVDRVEKRDVPVYTTVEKIVEVPQILEKIVERIVILPQVVEVLKYVHEISESEDLGLAVGVDVSVQERRYKELYGISRKQLDALLVELRRLRTTQPALAGHIDLLERYLTDFDKLAALQRIVPVDREVIVEKDVTRSVLVPVKDSESIRSELALSLLVEKLVSELKRVKKDNPNVNLNLDNELGLIFFPEFFDKVKAPVAADFTNSLRDYTQKSVAKLQNLGGNWTNDHELMIYTILQERFSIANLVLQANSELDKARSISDARAQSLHELENKFLQTSKLLADTDRDLSTLISQNPSLADNAALRRLQTNLNLFVTSSYAVKLEEPIRNLGEFVGSGNDWSRLLSFAREREAETDLLKRRIFDIERSYIKREFSGVDNERTLNNLRVENENLIREIDRIKSSASTSTNSANREKELELKLRTANARIQELESQLRTAELKLKELKDTKSSAASSAVEPNLVSSQYSSVSSSNPTFDQRYTTSRYSESSSVSSSDVRTPSYVQETTSTNVYGTNYGTSGTSAYQSTSRLTTSGRDINAGTSVPTATSGTYGSSIPSSTSGAYGSTSTGVTGYGSSGYGSSATTTTTGATTYGTTAQSTLTSSGIRSASGYTSGTTYGTSGTTGVTGGATYGASGVTGATTYGATGVTGGATYGASGSISSSYSSSSYGAGNTGSTTGAYGTSGATGSSVNSSLSSSGLRTSGTGLSGYQFQTKKY